MKAVFSTAAEDVDGTIRVRRARAFHRPGRLLITVLFLFSAFAGFALFILGCAALFWTDNREFGLYALVGLAILAVGRFVVFILARSLSCSLCYGPVMQEKGCRKHRDAQRLPFLSHRASAAVAVACTGTFRCMYCGTPYRLRK